MGVGLLGGSIGLAIKAQAIDIRVIGYGHRRSTLDAALRTGVIDEAFDNPADAVRDSHAVILATPVGTFPSLLQQIAPALRPNTIITDVGSTKRSIVRLAESLLPENVHFIGSHPMAGSEKRGVEFARADLFKNARCILTPPPASNPQALAAVDRFWQRLGMHTTHMSPEDHDRLVCDVSHFPHAVAAALIAMQSDAALPLAGKGFLDATRIAGGDGALWRDILQDNRDSLIESIVRLRAELDNLQSLLAPEHSEALRIWLDAAASRRAALLASKLKELHPE